MITRKGLFRTEKENYLMLLSGEKNPEKISYNSKSHTSIEWATTKGEFPIKDLPYIKYKYYTVYQ